MGSSYSQFLFICPSVLIAKPNRFGEGMGLSRRSPSLFSMHRMPKKKKKKSDLGTVFAIKPCFPHTSVIVCAAV